MPGISGEKFARIVRKNRMREWTFTSSHAADISASPEASIFATCSRVQARPVRFSNAARWSGQKQPGTPPQTIRVSSSTMKKSGFRSESVRHVRAT